VSARSHLALLIESCKVIKHDRGFGSQRSIRRFLHDMGQALMLIRAERPTSGPLRILPCRVNRAHLFMNDSIFQGVVERN
jgi:hypothetical protein